MYNYIIKKEFGSSRDVSGHPKGDYSRQLMYVCKFNFSFIKLRVIATGVDKAIVHEFTRSI